MTEDGLKLMAYFGERDRAGGGFLADALVAIYARHSLRTSIVMRGIEGFGAKHGLRTDRLLTLSEDLPLVSVAVDTRARIEAAMHDVEGLRSGGVVTLERARLLTGGLGAVELAEATKLTVYLGRHERIGGRPAYEAVVDVLQRHEVAGATVLLGVDGTAHGERRRAAFVGRNADVPLMVVAVGDGAKVAEALAELDTVLTRPLVTLERVTMCKRDGRRLAAPDPDPGGDVLHKLTVYAGEQTRLHHAIVRALREHGAGGATSLRGVWGYHGDHRPHGDTFWQLRRRVPVVTTTVDTAERIARSFALIDELTGETGLVTSEIVPVVRTA